MPVLVETDATSQTSLNTPGREQNAFDEAARIHRFCQEHHRLMSAFAETVDQILLLHQSRFAAVMNGQPLVDWIDALIEQAKHKKERAKRAYLEHTRRHGCA